MSGSEHELTVDAVRECLRQVEDPELHRDLVSLGMVKEIDVAANRVRVRIELTTPACPLKHVIGGDVRKQLQARWPEVEVSVDFASRVRASVPPQLERSAIGEVKNVVLVASGKGGVGKSTVAVNLAYALQQLGAAVGLADTDVYGPSLHLMTGARGLLQPSPSGKGMQPKIAHGLPLVSMGLLVDPDQPMIWRGPMLAGAALQLLTEVDWGALDYLVVDLPPGTGDVQLSIAQKIRVAGAVVVSTPQDVALADVVRAKRMFDKVGIATLGVIENMSYFICDSCNKRHEIFDSGGAERMAERLGTPFLGRLPIDVSLRVGGDQGIPVVVQHPESQIAHAFVDIAGRLAARLAVLASGDAISTAAPTGVQ